MFVFKHIKAVQAVRLARHTVACIKITVVLRGAQHWLHAVPSQSDELQAGAVLITMRARFHMLCACCSLFYSWWLCYRLLLLDTHLLLAATTYQQLAQGYRTSAARQGRRCQG